jgi:hypothetical protein
MSDVVSVDIVGTIGTPNQIEAVRTNLEHRSPSYED